MRRRISRRSVNPSGAASPGRMARPPSAGWCSPAMSLSSVDLPAPLAPNTAMCPPGETVRQMSLRISLRARKTVACSSTTSGSPSRGASSAGGVAACSRTGPSMALR